MMERVMSRDILLAQDPRSGRRGKCTRAELERTVSESRSSFCPATHVTAGYPPLGTLNR